MSEKGKPESAGREGNHPNPPGGTPEPGGLHVKKKGRSTDDAGPRGTQDGRPERQEPSTGEGG